MRFSAHLGYLYTELPLADRPAAAAADGFRVVEHPEPWEMPVPEWHKRLDDLGLSFAQVSSGMGTTKGLASLAGQETAFRDGFLRALDYAQGLKAPLLHPMAGQGGDDATYRANIDWALDRLAGTGIRLLVEPITSIPGYQMDSFAKAMALQDAVPQITLLFDSFHAANTGLDPTAWVQTHHSRIGHVHIADHPGRHEPGTGAIAFPPLLNALQSAGYAGAVGFEYIPRTSTADSLAFLPGWQKGFA